MPRAAHVGPPFSGRMLQKLANVRKQLERVLLQVQKPARYTGGEQGSIVKDPAQVDVVFTPDLPVNEGEIVDWVCRLQGIVDDQTLLSQLWFIRDPAEAVENLRRQRREAAQG